MKNIAVENGSIDFTDAEQIRSSKVGFVEKVGFGAGDAACNMLFNPITMFLSFFYTDIFGLVILPSNSGHATK